MIEVPLTEAQLRALREMAARSGRPVSELAGEGIDRMIAAQGMPDREELARRALEAAGRFCSGGATGSACHDDFLAEAYLGTKEGAVPLAEDELRAEYDFDYSEAEPNRFSADTIPAAPDPDEAG
ncbi:MAG TPA: hypothetical protein PLF84_23955 [Bryobacteraceae bacterium]|nr:hypothetical protein [Bryobacteraceae bacterium]